MALYKYQSQLIFERSVRSFQEKIDYLTSQGYYVNGSLVITKYIKSFIPFRLGNEYYVLMSRSIQKEKEL
jgi:hypothetical protein